MNKEPEYGGFSKRLVDKTINLFQPYYGYELGPKDAYEILISMKSYIKALDELAQTENLTNEKTININ